MSRQDKIANFNPDENGLRDFGIFGLPFEVEDAQIVLVPVPWEATVSYKDGTANGPEAILKASLQIDLYDPIAPDGWKAGIAMDDIPLDILEENAKNRKKALAYLEAYSSGEALTQHATDALADVNAAAQKVLDFVKDRTRTLMDQGKFVGIVGGEHSVPLGYMQALAEKHEYGILQIDAHADLRDAYEGFQYSHASIMHNALKIDNVRKLVQVGIRDFSNGEHEFAMQAGSRVKMFTDRDIDQARYTGKTWDAICDEIIATLPQNVYISFDIDGLQPWLCPNTGTPVAGGLLLEEAIYLLEKLSNSGKKIIGFDLCEVAPGPAGDEWDGNVGCRVLYKLCLIAAQSGALFKNSLTS